MKKSRFVEIAILLVTLSILSGCILVPEDEGRRGGGYHDNGQRDHHEGNYERH